MKKLIYKLCLFSAIVAVVILTPVMTTIAVMRQASFKVAKNKNILVMGASHTAYAIDDSIFTRSINLSQCGTAYLYSYLKIKKVLENNPQIDTVLLSFGYSAVIYGAQRLQKEEAFKAQVPTYISLLEKDDFRAYKDKDALLQSIFAVPIQKGGVVLYYFQKGKALFSYKDLKIGGYLKSDRQKLQADIDMQQYENMTTELPQESAAEKDYLLKIVNLCKEHRVKLILIHSPTYQPDVYGHLDKLEAYRQKYLKDVAYVDYSGFKFPSDSCYGDIRHLNYKGAAIFSQYLQEHFGRK
jgi:hypothetical protein